MVARRVDMHRLQELIRLHRLEVGRRAMARALKMGRDQVSKYLHAFAAAGLLDGAPDDLPDLDTVTAAVAARVEGPQTLPLRSSLAKWRTVIAKLLKRGAGPTAIYDRLRLEHDDFPGSLSAVKRLCRRLQRDEGVKPEDVVIPVETDPGEVAYVDFGYAGKRYDRDRGVLRKSWVFVMVLGYSRHMVAFLCFDQKITTWLMLHVRAFQVLGGVPGTVVPDNLKSAVIRAAFGIDDKVGLNRSYRELARHYGFRIEPTRPRTPEHKGKVESGVKYVKRNFLAAWEPVDLAADDRALQHWLREIAGHRRHGTTGRAPAEVFEREERAHLLPLPTTPYQLIVWKQARVHRDCHIQIDGAFYSAPWNLVQETLWARCTPFHITLYHNDQRLAEHGRQPRGKRSTNPDHLPEHRRDLRHRSRTFWEQRAILVGPCTHELVQMVFDQDDVLSHLRAVQAIVTHLETFPRKRAEAASERALFFRSLGYQEIKNILRKGLDLQPLRKTESRLWSRNARFARKPSELPLFSGERSCPPPTN